MAETIVYYQRFSHDQDRNVSGFFRINYAALQGTGLLEQPHSHETHYADAAFEGIRAKADEGGNLALIHAEESAARLWRSMGALSLRHSPSIPGLPPLPSDLERELQTYDSSSDVFVPEEFTPEHFQRLLIEAVQENVKACTIHPLENKLYIRPVIHRASHPEGKLGVYSLQHDIVLRIIVQEWGDYLPNGLALVAYPDGVEDPMRRIKCSANYALGSRAKNFAAAFPARSRLVTFDDALLTDNRGNIEEATGANFFAITNGGTIATPSTMQYILEGNTRRTAITLARNLGFEVVERDITLPELSDMAAAFLTGTATGLRSIRLVYNPPSQKVYSFDPQHEAFLALQSEFNNLITGGDVAPTNRSLQARVRSVIAPCNEAS